MKNELQKYECYFTQYYVIYDCMEKIQTGSEQVKNLHQ